MLGQLKHEGIVRIYDAYFRDGVVLDMVLELCPKGSMKEYIQSNYEMFPTSYPNKVYIRPASGPSKANARGPGNEME